MTIDRHTALEELIFRGINSDGGRLADLLAVTLSSRWFGVLVGAAIVVAIAVASGRRRLALLIAFVVAVVLSDLAGAQVLRPLIGRMRPCFALAGTVRWLTPVSDVGSVPSLHASNFFAMAAVAWGVGRRLGLAILLLAAAVALSRVYVGVHWPTDVLAGAAWGTLCGIVGLTFARRAIRAWCDPARPRTRRRRPLRNGGGDDPGLHARRPDRE
jgi:undecaprenyl-diphosphatase